VIHALPISSSLTFSRTTLLHKVCLQTSAFYYIAEYCRRVCTAVPLKIPVIRGLVQISALTPASLRFVNPSRQMM
jgi:hypothetical protein